MGGEETRRDGDRKVTPVLKERWMERRQGGMGIESDTSNEREMGGDGAEQKTKMKPGRGISFR